MWIPRPCWERTFAAAPMPICGPLRRAQERLLVTQDLDFSDIRIFKPGTHHGLLLVRLPDSEQWRVGDYVCAWLSAPESPSWSGCIVVATKNKVRARRP